MQYTYENIELKKTSLTHFTLFIIILCVWVFLLAYMSVHTHSWYPKRSEEAVRFPRY